MRKYQLILPVIITVLGSASKATAQLGDVSTLDWEQISSYELTEETRLLSSAPSGLPPERKNVQSSTTGELQAKQIKLVNSEGNFPCGNCFTQQPSDFKYSTLQGQLPELTDPPNPTIPEIPPQQTPIPPTPQEEPLKPQRPTIPPPSLRRSPIPGTIIVKRFEFTGDYKAFSTEELAAVTQRFRGRPITFAELLQAEAAITKKYADAGYVNSGAVISAEQILDPEEAVVNIQIVEGGLEDIMITGTERLNPGYVRSRLAIATEKPLNQNRLLEALQLLQLDPLIQNLSAELSAGSRPELSLLEVKITEAETLRIESFIDNSRAPSVGSFRRGINFNQANFLGFGDSLGLEYTNTDGSDAFNLNYRVPINPRNGTITIAAGLSDTEVIEPPFDIIDITGDSRYLDLSYRQPIVQTPTTELSLGITASRQESKTEILGIEEPLSAGADDRGRTRISALRFFQEWTQRSRQEVFAARSQFNLGLGIFDATVNEEPPDSRFFSWRGQAQYVRLLARDSLLVVRSDLQLATETLLPLEQFRLGGVQSVRGYRQDVLLTDNGILASAEVRLPILRVEKIEGILHVVPFVDFGIGWNSSGNPDPDPNTLLGFGFGLQLQMGDRLSARLDWGIPLINIESRERTWQENGLYFSVNFNPF
ncbi:ShlB/FhaC/HecB family hemolysin secretion/activation protein [Lyngbya aestuarii]|uniref:ShlB/FhaC/HecB family hemolysin secretion/activation protein n=1 Tax=Lyngbya aestuarii TaxID=118322 RepID=UPI00403E0709